MSSLETGWENMCFIQSTVFVKFDSYPKCFPQICLNFIAKKKIKPEISRK